jgi:hypothetical protein
LAGNAGELGVRRHGIETIFLGLIHFYVALQAL